MSLYHPPHPIPSQLAIDPGLGPPHPNTCGRAAEALFAMGERHTVKESMELWGRVLELEPENESYKMSHQRVCLEWESDYSN